MCPDELLELLSGKWVLFAPPRPEADAGGTHGFHDYADVKRLGGGVRLLELRWSVAGEEDAETRVLLTFGLRPAAVKELAEKYQVKSFIVNDERGLREVCVQPVPAPEGEEGFLYLPGDTIRLMSPEHKSSFTVAEAEKLLFGLRPVTASLEGGKTLQDPRVFFAVPPKPGAFHGSWRIWPAL